MRCLLLCLALAGCATGADNPSCAAGGSYEAGRSDAMFGRRPACDASAADYQLGWAIGYSETSFRQPN
jgi:hypothetical protein